jgi:hypothetical protein
MRDVVLDPYDMGGHGVLGRVEGRVKRGEIAPELHTPISTACADV